MANPMPRPEQFRRLPEREQVKYGELLHALDRLSLSCRCEMVGGDFTVVVGPGYARARYWIDHLQIDD